MSKFKVTMSWEVQVKTEIEADTMKEAANVADLMGFNNPAWEIIHTEWHYSGGIEEVGKPDTYKNLCNSSLY